MDAAILEKEALELPDIDRALLADRLMQSLSRVSPDLEGKWLEETVERMDAYESGKINAMDGEESMKQLRSMFAPS